MEDMFWICPDCGAANQYPEITECEVCSRPISEKEISEAESKLREAEKAREEFERAERKAEELKRRQEAERERLMKLEEKHRLQREKTLKIRKIVERINKSLKPLTTTASVIIVIAVLACSVLVGISVVRQDSMDVMISEIELISQRIYEDFSDGHFFEYYSGENEFIPFRNIRIQFQYIERHFSNSRALQYLTEILGW